MMMTCDTDDPVFVLSASRAEIAIIVVDHPACPWAVVVVDPLDSGASEGGRFPTFSDAVASLRLVASAEGDIAPVADDPLAVFFVGDGSAVGIAKTAPGTFVAVDTASSPVPVALCNDLGTAIVDLACAPVHA